MTDRPELIEIRGTAIEMHGEKIGWLEADLGALKRREAIHAITSARHHYDRAELAEDKLRELEDPSE
jgi:hypothetical protein